MKYALLLAALFLLPASALAAAPTATSTFAFSRALLTTAAAPSNAYYAAGSLDVSSSTAGDLSALAGSMTVAAPVKGDALLVGGAVTLRAPIGGDLRALGARITIAGPVSGDEVLFGGSVTDTSGSAREVFIVGGSVTMSAGAAGPVTIYGNDVTLGGTFDGDVKIVSSGQVSVEPGTDIRGALDYEAPQQASVAASSTIKGGVHYTGASYLPTSAQAHALALAAVGVFLIVKILGALILAGLLAGIFPLLAEQVSTEALKRPARGVLLTTLLGFGIAVATPVLLVLLALTFVGLGLALLLGAAYFLLCVLAFAYTGIIMGGAIARSVWKRDTILWHDGVLGMLVVCLIAIVPVIGFPLVLLLAAFAEGALAKLFYRAAFSHEHATDPLL